jgi:type IX secretion system PorP/SprF family membrane protein
MKKISLLIILLAALNLQVRSQDTHFSQLTETPIWYNPANTGFFPGYVRASVHYRNQWASMGNPYKTMGLSVDGSMFKNRKKSAFLGLGLTMFSDKAGAANISNTNIALNVAGIVKLSKKSVLSAAVYGGEIVNKASYNDLQYGNQFNGNEIDPNLPSNENVAYRNFTTNDLGAGLAYEFSNVKGSQDRLDVVSFRIGAAAYHLNKPTQNFGSGTSYRLPTRYVGSATVRVDIPGSKLSILPSLIYMRQDALAPAYEINFGTFVKYRFKTGTKTTGQKTENGFAIGAYYRYDDAIIPQILLDMGSYAIGMSYDINVSGYKRASRTVGGFEVSLRYTKLGDALFNKKSEYRN